MNRSLSSLCHSGLVPESIPAKTRQAPTCDVGNPADIASRHPSRKAFTLIELLIVIAIIAILSITVVLTLNPAEMLRQARDSTRTNDLSTLQTALNLYVTDTSVSGSLQLGLVNTVYTSLPDASSTCGSWGLPALPAGWSYHCATATSSKNIDSNGWIPVNLKTMSLGSSLGSLPIDPMNSSSTGLYYTYQTDGQKYEVTSLLESSKYKAQYAQNPQVSGYPEVLAEGSNLTISPLWNPSGLVGYWPLDEGTGTVATDQSGNGNGGTLSTIPPVWFTSCKVGTSCLNFSATSSQLITVNDAPSLSSASAITIIFWFYPITTSADNNDPIIQKGNGGVTTNYDVLWFGQAAGSANNSLNLDSSFGSSWNGVGGGKAAFGGWHYIALTYISGAAKEYIDGSLISTASLTGNLGTNSMNLLIGKSFNDASFYMDDVRIYNRALSASEVQALYNAEK